MDAYNNFACKEGNWISCLIAKGLMDEAHLIDAINKPKMVEKCFQFEKNVRQLKGNHALEINLNTQPTSQ